MRWWELLVRQSVGLLSHQKSAIREANIAFVQSKARTSAYMNMFISCLQANGVLYCFGDLLIVSNCWQARNSTTMTGGTYEGE